MSHPNDEGNSVVSRALSAIRKKREEKAARTFAAPRQRLDDQELTPKQPEQKTDLSRDKSDEDSPTDPVVDSTDSPATETEAPEADNKESTDSADAADEDSADDVDKSEATPADQPSSEDEPADTEAEAAATEPDTATDDGGTTEPSDDESPASTEDEPEVEPATDKSDDALATAEESEPEATEETEDTVEDDSAETGSADEEADGESAAESEEAAATEPEADTSADATTETDTDSGPDAAATIPIPTGKTTAATAAAAGAGAAAAKGSGAGDDIPGDENETAKFAAVPAKTPDKPVGSPADEKKTEVIATDPSAPTEVIEAPTEKINVAKPAARPTPKPTPPPPPRPAPVPANDWKAEPKAPQYIPAGGGSAQGRPSGERPTKSRKGLWIGLAALVAIVVVAAVVIGLVSSGGDSSKPAADVAAERALEYTTALRDGDINELRSITCGDAQARFANMSDQAFAEDHRVQEAHNELVGVDGVKASKIVEDGNGAVVEVSAYKTGTPDEKLDVALTLSKVDGEWKVCKA